MNPVDLYVNALVLFVVVFLSAGYFVPAYYAYRDMIQEDPTEKRKAILFALGWPAVVAGIITYEIWYYFFRRKRTAT